MTLSGLSLRSFQTAMCCMGFLLLGYDQGVMSGIIGATNQFGKDFNSPSASLQGTIVSIYDIGCAVGALIAFVIGEKAGRRYMIMMGGSIMIVGTAILASSTTLAQLLVGRVVTGIGNGFNCSSIPMYQAETCSPRLRGRLVCLQSSMTIIGLVISYYLDIGFTYVDGPAQWRFPIAFQGVFAVCLVAMAIFLPDTPRWLFEQNRPEQATQVLANISGKSSESDEVQLAAREIVRSLEYEKTLSGSSAFKISELWQGGSSGNWRRVALSCGILVMQQATGANMINYYAPVVYQNAMGLSRNVALQLGGGTSLTYLLASFIPLFTVDRFGRRTLLMISSLGMAFCFFMTAILLGIAEKKTGPLASSLGAAGTAFVFVFQIFLGLGWLGIPFLYPTEISTTRIRSKAAALGTFFNWMSVFVVVQITPTAIDSIAWRTFIIFGAFNLAFLPIIYCFFPETSGLSLEEVDRIFEKQGFTGGVFGSKGGYTVQPGSGGSVLPGIESTVEDIRIDDHKNLAA